MPTATATATREKNASGRSWSAGPYVRKGERDQWNDFYEEFTAELQVSADYPQGVTLTVQQIDTVAYNCAYRAIWSLRTDDHGER